MFKAVLICSSCLTGIPIAGEILSYDKGDYWGLIVFTGICYVAAFACFVAARVVSRFPSTLLPIE